MAEELGQATPAATPESLSVEDRFSNYLSPPEEKKAEESPPPEAVPPSEAPPTETPPADEQPSLEVDPEIPFLEITTKAPDGSDQVKKWSLNEMKSGVMMQADYQRKTAELARQRETVPQEVQKQVQEATNHYAHTVATFHQVFQAIAAQELQGVNWNDLATKDPAEFVRLSHRANQINGALQAAQQEVDRLARQYEEKGQQDTAKAAQEAVEVLSRKLPNWGNELYSSILKTGVDYGLKPEVVGRVTDPILIEILHDAHQWRALQKAKPAMAKKLAAVPKVLASGTPPPRTEQPQQYTDARKSLRKSGRVDDAARVFYEREKLRS